MPDDGVRDPRLVAVTDEQEVFVLRRDARTIAEAVGADRQDRIRLAAPNPAVELLFPAPDTLPTLVTDETVDADALRRALEDGSAWA